LKQFSSAKKWLSEVDAEAASRLVTASADVALILSPGNPAIIRDIAFGSDEVANEIGTKWIGEPWVDVVSPDSRQKVVELLADAASENTPRRRHINHHSPGSTEDLPILYSATRIGPKGRIVAVGRSLRPIAALQQRLLDTQQSMDREYARLQQAETRHRLLFQVSAEAVLIADATTRKIVEANPAASALLDQPEAALIGRGLVESFDAAGRRALDTLLASVRATGRTDEARAKAARGGAEFLVSAALFREDRSSYFLIRLTPRKAAGAAAPATLRSSRVLEIVAASPDAFLVTSVDGRVEYSNRAFLDMVQLAAEEQVRGESVERWLGRPGVDFNLLTAHLREHASIRLFATTLRGEYGAVTDVEICAVSIPDGDMRCLGFTMRNVGQRVTAERRAHRDRPRSVEQLTELVGRVPLKELVRESSDMIEKLCIEAALELTGDNRASAAEILGLSRQSLYAKLRRYNLGDLGPSDDDQAGASH
jgi:transcriptional regulator PpsR